MRIGILQADSVLAHLAPRYGDYGRMFRELLADPRARDPGAAAPEFMDIDVQAGPLPEPDACDGYVITGSRHSVYDELPWIEPLVDFLRAARRQRRGVVGICFGHQLMAHFFGGEVRPAAGGWCVGVHSAEVVASESWMHPAAARVALLASHRDQVVRLPPGARLFARGDRCPLAGFVMDGVLTFQGHPEFSKPYAAELMDMRESLLGATVFEQGKGSLVHATDNALVARWILNFMGARG